MMTILKSLEKSTKIFRITVYKKSKYGLEQTTMSIHTKNHLKKGFFLKYQHSKINVPFSIEDE